MGYFDKLDLDPTLFRPPEQTKEDSPTSRGWTESFQQLPQLGYGLLAGAGAAGEKVFGEGGIASALKNAGIEGYERWGQKIAEKAQPNDSWDVAWDKAYNGGDYGALADWLKHGLGYVGGQGIQMLATAGIGGMAGKFVASTAAKEIAEGMVSKEIARIGAEQAAKTGERLSADAVVKQATENVAAKFAAIGQNVGIGGMAFGQEGGEIFGDLTADAQREGRTLTGTDLGRAFAATLAAGALEFVGDKIGLDVFLGKSPLLKPTAALPGLKGRLVRGALAGAAEAPIEGATEFGQTLTEEYGKGNDPFSDESIKQAWEAAALGTLGGAAMGGIGGMLHGAHTPAAAPAAPPLQLTHNPDPWIAFPDGTVGKRADVERYVAGLPEDQRADARARLLGLAAQPGAIPAGEATELGPATISSILSAESVDEAAAAALRGLGLGPTLPVGETTELAAADLPPGVAGMLTTPQTEPLPGMLPVGEASELIPVGEAGPVPRRIPTGEATELEPEAIAPEVPPPPAAGMTPRRSSEPAPIDLSTGAAAIAGFLNRLEGTNTPAARAFLGDYRAGRITNADIMARLVPSAAAPTPDQRLAAAAAQAPSNEVQPGDLLTQDGMPYGSKTAASIRAKREGGNLIEIPGAGWVVRREAPPTIPTGEATEILPTGDVVEQPGAIPTGEATEVIPTGDAAPLPRALPVGEATELEPETVSPEAPARTDEAGRAPLAPPAELHYGRSHTIKRTDEPWQARFYTERAPNGRIRLVSYSNHNSVGAFDTEEEAAAEGRLMFERRFAKKEPENAPVPRIEPQGGEQQHQDRAGGRETTQAGDRNRPERGQAQPGEEGAARGEVGGEAAAAPAAAPQRETITPADRAKARETRKRIDALRALKECLSHG